MPVSGPEQPQSVANVLSSYLPRPLFQGPVEEISVRLAHVALHSKMRRNNLMANLYSSYIRFPTTVDQAEASIAGRVI